MFTPPNSIALDNRPRRNTWNQSEPASGIHSQAEGTNLHLPPLTPLPAEDPASAQPAAHAALDSHSSANDMQQTPPVQALSSSRVKQLNTAADECNLMQQSTTAALSPARQKQAGIQETPLLAAGVSMDASARTPPQLSENLSRSRWQQQQASSMQPGAALAKMFGSKSRQSSRAASAETAAACADCSGPPITRMRPPVPNMPLNTSRKAASKAQSSTGSAADEVLLDAVLCGWEEEGNDRVSESIVYMM